MLQTNTRHHTLGVSRAGAGTRLWLEGKRLLAHGFTHGTLCARDWSRGCLVIRPVGQDEFNTLERDQRSSIAGAPARPILDITGLAIAQTFPTGHVMVTWSHNQITIEGV